MSDTQLTPQEQADYDRLIAAEDVAEQTEKQKRQEFKFTEQFQQLIIGAIISDPVFCKEAVKTIKPSFFTASSHKNIATLVFRYFDKYGSLPSETVLDQQLREEIKSKDEYGRTGCELATCRMYYVPNVEDRQAMLDAIYQYARRYGALHAIREYVDGDTELDEAIARLQAAQKKGGGAKIKRWSDIKQQAEEQSEDWLIPNWLEFGSLGMLTGLPFAGKSVIVGGIIAAIANSQKWCDMRLPACPIILIDLENKERILVRRIEAALQGNEGEIGELLHVVDRHAIELPLDAGQLERILAELGKIEKALVIIDTLRSAFPSRSSNDEEDMKDILYPLQRFAQAHNLAVLLLHHNKKSGGYSGSTTIPGACDYFWEWNSDRKSGVGTLSLEGTRGEPQDALEFKYEYGRNIFVGRSGDVAKIKRQAETDGELLPVLACCPIDWTDSGKIREEVMTKCGLEERAARRLLTKAEQLGYIESQGQTKYKQIKLTEKGLGA